MNGLQPIAFVTTCEVLQGAKAVLLKGDVAFAFNPTIILTLFAKYDRFCKE
jgi:hypothetical protein